MITDGRFSGGTHGFVVGHITPEAYDGGTIALVKDDDTIEIDILTNTITLKISEEEIERRRAAWKQPTLKASKGILFKYAMQVKTAAEGCVTDELPPTPEEEFGKSKHIQHSEKEFAEKK